MGIYFDNVFLKVQCCLHRYVRMSPERFEHLLQLVGSKITKQNTQFRTAISAEERLIVTLRILASGEDQQSLSFSFRIAKSAISQIINETTEAIYCSLKDEYLTMPCSQNEWQKIAEDFENLWNFPHCIGALDGKHIRIECPSLSGSLYHNFKGFFSIVLLAICDSKYCFTLFDLGQYGSNNDSGALLKSKISELFENSVLNIPPPSDIDGFPSNPVPYVLLGDEIFPLKMWLLRSFSGPLMEEQRIFAYRLSRARRTTENAFGILTARWRIFHKPIRSSVENAERYTLACLALHNYLRLTDNAMYCPEEFVDSYNNSGKIKEGEWRSLVNNENSSITGITPLRSVRGSRYREDSIALRNSFATYFSNERSVSWQWDHVRRTSYQPVTD